ncbi:calumenin-like [Watersipora subatra]|uniref:calumenin-like n=1 Tax=Watersipora subatra TaxID=2589382 RepID=UPI00355BC78D
MKLYINTAVIGVLCLASVSASAIRNRANDKRTKEKELSEHAHNEGAEHNAQYDHEAFLGREQAMQFDHYSPEESKEKLKPIVIKIDKDKDGFVSEKELVNWIRYIQKSYVTQDSKTQWTGYDKSETDTISWEEYERRTFGDHAEEFNDKLREARRFNVADTNYDGVLSFTEFVDFLHPEDVEHMREIVVMETIEDIDQDGDGLITEAEYIGDMYPKRDEDEPDWVKTEREHFSKWRDLNKDGVMDKEEVKNWIMPDDYDHAEAESKHLIYETDMNKDGKLSMEEILERAPLYVGSQVTDFGEALSKSHDEF